VVTEQVKRVSAALRAVGFKRGEFSCRAERKHKRDRSNGGRRYIEFGPACATFHYNSRDPERTLEHRALAAAPALVELGMVVQVFTRGGVLEFVTVREPDYRETPTVYERDLALPWDDPEATKVCYTEGERQTTSRV
jgi:hypothetical protein